MLMVMVSWFEEDALAHLSRRCVIPCEEAHEDEVERGGESRSVEERLGGVDGEEVVARLHHVLPLR